MSRVAVRVVLIAAALLPPQQRNRYREQWLGELRDAPTLGVRTSDIAFGSLAFAATSARPLPTGGRLSAEMISRRARLAIALALSAAVLASAQFASPPMSAPTSTDLAGSTIATLTLMLTLYSVLAPLVAAFIALATRGMNRGARAKILLLCVGCAAPLAYSAITNQIQSGVYGFYLALVTIFLPAAFALIALVAWRLLRRRHPLGGVPSAQRTRRRMLWSTLAGALVAFVVAATFLRATALWNGRTPLFFRDAVTTSNRADYEQWLWLKSTIEQMVMTTLVAWFVVGLVIALAVVLYGLNRRSNLRSILLLGFGAVSVVSLSFGAVMEFLAEVTPSTPPGFQPELTTVLGQLGLTVVVLLGTRGSRAEAPARPVPERALDRAASSHG